METEKKEQEPINKSHSMIAGKIILGIALIVLVGGIAFGAGRVSQRGRFFRNGMMVGRCVAPLSDLGGRGFTGSRTMNRTNENRLVGQISAVNSESITVKDVDGTEYTVNILDTTSVVISGKIDKASNLKTGTEVVVFGTSKSDGSVNASAVRVR